jgi:Zn-dependent peptidase ImmA (M78 family)
MTVKWEKFAGSTDVFAVRLSFNPDPDQGAAADSDESVSWGSLQLWVRGQNLCAHADQGELLQAVHWYMLPVLEWLTESWDPLLHEERLPNRNFEDTAVESLAATRNPPALAGELDTALWEQEWYTWYGRHALRSARNGGLFPNVILRRLRDYIEISWNNEPSPGTPPGFRFSLGPGANLLDPSDVADPLYELLTEAVGYLHRQAPESTRLAALRARVAELPGHAEARVRWLSGLPAYSQPLSDLKRSATDRIRESWVDISNTIRRFPGRGAVEAALSVDESPLVVTGSCQAALLFGSVSPTVSADDVYRLASVLITQYTSLEAENDELRSLVSQVAPGDGFLAWEQGYDLAESLHDVLKLAGDWVDVRQVLRRFNISQIRRTLDDASIRGCSIVGPQHKPTIVVNKSSRYSDKSSRYSDGSAGVRFTIAHELCHILYDRAHGRRLAIASGPWAPRNIEKRANAFSAMFLMPPHLVQRALADSPDPITELAGVRAVARRLHVSAYAAIEHLCNLTLMTEIERDELIAQLVPGSR